MSISGLNFKWDSNLEPGNRIKSVRMWKDDAAIDTQKSYTIALKNFIALGKDGFTCF